MYLAKHNDINLPTIVLLLAMIVLSTLSSSRATTISISEGHKVTSNFSNYCNNLYFNVMNKTI